MKASIGGLKNVLSTSVVELKFSRRRPKAGQPTTRRMLCTTAHTLLDSLAGQTVFKFTDPTRSPKYNPTAKNLAIVYDLFALDFRAIPIETCSIISVIPVATEKDILEFWEYFNKNIAPMSSDEKMRFMNT